MDEWSLPCALKMAASRSVQGNQEFSWSLRIIWGRSSLIMPFNFQFLYFSPVIVSFIFSTACLDVLILRDLVRFGTLLFGEMDVGKVEGAD